VGRRWRRAAPRIVLAAQGAAEMTVTALVDADLADPEKAALRSRAEIERWLRKNVVPLIGAVRVTELRRRDARTVTDARLRRDRKVEATRVFEDLHAMVRWVVQNEYLEVSTLDGMTKLAGARTGDRVLTGDEIRVLWQGLPAALGPKPGSSELAIFWKINRWIHATRRSVSSRRPHPMSAIGRFC
jgi:hypothetical protein